MTMRCSPQAQAQRGGGAKQGEGERSSPEQRHTGEGAVAALVAMFPVDGGAPVVLVSDGVALEL
jgi:hypothetical protein